MSSCSIISAGITPDCINPIVPGVKDSCWVFNYDDIAGYTYDGTNPEIVTGILLNSGATAYIFQGQNFSNEFSYEIRKSTYNNAFGHQFRFRAFADDPSTKSQINKMINGKFVVVAGNNYINAAGNTAYTIYGKDAGLYIQEGGQQKNNVDTGGAHEIYMTSHDSAPEPKVPASVFDTDYATTLAMLTALE